MKRKAGGFERRVMSDLADARRTDRDLRREKEMDRAKMIRRIVAEHEHEFSRPLIDASLLTWSEREEIRSRVKAQRWTKQDGRTKGQLI